MTQYAATAVADIDPGVCGAGVKLSHRGYLRLWNVGKRCVFYRHKPGFKGPEALRFKSHLLSATKKKKLGTPIGVPSFFG